MELSDLGPELRIARPPVLSGRVELTGQSQPTFSQTPQKDVAVELGGKVRSARFLPRLMKVNWLSNSYFILAKILRRRAKRQSIP